MIDLVVSGISRGTTVVAGLKLLAYMEKRRNGNGFSQNDHDVLILVKAGLDELHTDLMEIKGLLIR